MSDPSPTRDVWNSQQALECVDGRESDLRDLLEIWLRQSPHLLFEIQTAMGNNDAERLMLAAHTLKGSLQILCADEACTYAAGLEIAGQKRLASTAAGLLPKLESEIASLTRLITAYLHRP